MTQQVEQVEQTKQETMMLESGEAQALMNAVWQALAPYFARIDVLEQQNATLNQRLGVVEQGREGEGDRDAVGIAAALATGTAHTTRLDELEGAVAEIVNWSGQVNGAVQQLNEQSNVVAHTVTRLVGGVDERTLPAWRAFVVGECVRLDVNVKELIHAQRAQGDGQGEMVEMSEVDEPAAEPGEVAGE